MSPPDQPALPDDLPARFPENRRGHTSDAGAMPPLRPFPRDLPSPDVLLGELPVPAEGARPRIAFADDDENFLRAIQTSARAQEKAVDIRTWSPTQEGLADWIRMQQADDWQPDLLVLDINLDDGGKTGHEYLTELRLTPGLARLPIVLATGNLLRDLDQDRLSVRPDGAKVSNNTRERPARWLAVAREWEPEAILYGKSGDRSFLRRLVENLSVWREIARRRAWSSLLARVAALLDGHQPIPEAVGALIASYAHAELGVSDIFVRWRSSGGRYRLIGCFASWPYESPGHELDPATIPLLAKLVHNYAGPVCNNDGVTESEAGTLTRL